MMPVFSRFRIAGRAALVGLALFALPASAALAQDQGQNQKQDQKQDQDQMDLTPPEVSPEVNNFKLSEDLLTRMEKVHDALSRMDLSATEEEGSDPDPTIDQMVASIEARPKVVAILKAENIAPREYVVAYFALMSCLAAADSEDEEQMVDDTKNINPDHIAFGKKYSERIRQLIGE